MARGGARPGAGRPRGSRKLVVPVLLPAVETGADFLLAALRDPDVMAALGNRGGYGGLVPHMLSVEISTERVPSITVRPYRSE